MKVLLPSNDRQFTIRDTDWFDAERGWLWRSCISGRGSLVRVLVVDDFQPWQKFIASVLHSDSNYTVVAFASDGLEAIKLCQEMQPELIVMDINLPNCSGITAAKEIRRLLPRVEIVFFTRDIDHEFVQAALNLRAKGFVAKNDAHDLLRAITSVVKGERYLSEEVVRRFRSIDSDGNEE